MYVFCQKDYNLPASSEEISHFLKQLSKNHEYWQVQQASNAIHTYNFYLRRNKLRNQKHNAEPDELWRAVADDTHVAGTNFMGVKSPFDSLA